MGKTKCDQKRTTQKRRKYDVITYEVPFVLLIDEAKADRVSYRGEELSCLSL